MGLSGRLLPVHFAPLQDELLSSWIVRLAKSHGHKAQTFTTLLFSNNQTWTRDIDYSIKPDTLNIIIERTGKTESLVYSTTLKKYESYLFEKIMPNGHTSWILPLGVFHRDRKRFGQQYCPKCLRSDHIPYFRTRWRLALIPVCLDHNCLLLDQCPFCSSSIQFHRIDINSRVWATESALSVCYNCKYDIRAGPAKRIPIDVQTQHIKIQKILADGYITIKNNTNVYSHLFFNVLRNIAGLLMRRGKSLRLRKLVEINSRIEIPPSSDHRYLEYMSISERLNILAASMWLLDKWPERFVNILKEANLSKSWILHDFRNPPYWFWAVVHEKLNKSSYIVNEEELTAAIRYLQKHHLSVNKKAISRLLANDLSKSINKYFGNIDTIFNP